MIAGMRANKPTLFQSVELNPLRKKTQMSQTANNLLKKFKSTALTLKTSP